MARYMRQQWDPAQHSSSQHLWASSVSLLGGRSGEALPGHAVLPLSVSTAGSRGRCQDRAVCVKWMQLGWVWAELDMGKSFQSVWQGSSHHAELRGHQCGVCSRSERVSLAVFETCPSVQEPLWGHSPAPLGSGSLHSLHRILKRPVHSPVLYQAKMQELNEFLKLVLVSAFFF